MRLAIMQPYFLPYLGYWQLLGAVDRFVVYDNIKYTKKGWINRNRFLLHGQDKLFTIPLSKDSDYLDIVERSVAADFDAEKLLNQLGTAYRKAPFYSGVFPLLRSIVTAPHQNLFDYIHFSIQATAEFLGIKTPLVISSTIGIDHSLRSQEKVLAICQAMGAKTYINAIGGQELYSEDAFEEARITLQFIQMRPIVYAQFSEPFVANLSILDAMMFNSRDDIQSMLLEYDLV